MTMAMGAVLAMTGGALAQTEVRFLNPESEGQSGAFWQSVVDAYEAANPDVDVVVQFMSGNDMMAKLPTLLASDAAPHIFYTWGGGVMKALAETGNLKDLTADFDADGGALRNAYAPAAIDAFSVNDSIWAVPYKFNLVQFTYNKALFEQAGITAEDMANWDGFLAGVEKLKEAGITPIAMGAQDRWPVHLMWTYLVMREGGGEAFTQAKAGEGDGFEAEPFIAAGERLQELAALEPFQRGFEAAGWSEMQTEMADGRAAMILGFAETPLSVNNSASDGLGVPAEDLGAFFFPVIEGGSGDPAETFGGNNGWMLFRDAPPEALDFIAFATNAESQAQFAALNVAIPTVPSAVEAITEPILADAARAVVGSSFHQNYLDQDLGPAVGWGVVNDMVVEVLTGRTEPADAAAQIEEAWQFEMAGQ